MSAIYDIKNILFYNLKMKTQESEKINIAKKKREMALPFPVQPVHRKCLD